MHIKFFQLVRSFLLLYGFYGLGEIIAYLLPFGVPASIWGLLALLAGLVSNIIKVEWIFIGANLLIRYMAILFIPVSVGIIQYPELLMSQAEILLLPNIISTSLTLILVAFLADYLFIRSNSTKQSKESAKQNNGGSL